MFPKKELKVIRKLLEGETYHIPIQEELERKDIIKRHADRNLMDEIMDEKLIDDIWADKIAGIMGG